MALGGLLLVAGLCLGPVEETDLFFRMAAGEQFLRTGRLVHRNLFSFTYPDAPYLDSAWLFDVATAALYRLGGFPAVVVGKTMVVLLVAGLGYRVCRKLGAGPLIAAAVLSLAFVCMRERLVERPHVFSLLGEVALLDLLPSIVTAERRRWLVLPLAVLWVNLHAGAFLAATILGLAATGAVLDRQPSRVVVRLAAFGGLATLLLMASPVGAGILSYLTFHVGVFDLHPVDEFRNATWRSDWPFVLFAFGATLVVVTSKRQSWLLRLPALGLVAMGIWHIRFSADATLVLAVAAAPAVTTLASRFDWLVSRVAVAVFLAVVGVVTLGPRIAAASRGERFVAVDLDRRSLPEEARMFVEEHGLRDRMYNDFETGSYLLWQGYPRYRVFVDPRLPAYPAEFHRLLGRMDISRQEWTAAMEALGVESALLDYAGINRRVSYWDPEAWALLFRAKDARVFVRRLPKWRRLIEQFEIPASFDFTVENGAVTLPLEAPPAASPVAPCEWAFRLGDLSFDLEGTTSAKALAGYRAALAAPSGCLAPEHELSAAAWMGSLDLAARDFPRALSLLDRALARAPEDTAVLANRALALQGLGRDTEARETWASIARLEPTSVLGRKAAALAQPRGP